MLQPQVSTDDEETHQQSDLALLMTQWTRSVKTGLTASVIVSQWTWAATLLQSSNVAWNYGISGPFWYASGATIQVLLFGILALQQGNAIESYHGIA